MTSRRWNGGKLVIASHNEGKVREIRALLEPFGAEIVSAGALGLPEPNETEITFIGNAFAARVFLHERVDRRRWIAAVLVAGGVALLAG